MNVFAGFARTRTHTHTAGFACTEPLHEHFHR